jgi:hypothetical protein
LFLLYTQHSINIIYPNKQHTQTHTSSSSVKPSQQQLQTKSPYTQKKHNESAKMPAVPKSYLPTFAAFLIGGITLTAFGAAREGANIDGARTRWQNQHASAQRVLSGGVGVGAEMEARQT